MTEMARRFLRQRFSSAGIVIAIAQTISPETMRGSHFVFCSSVP